ncbi:MAG: hypothetical protein US98_C0024G0003 [Parcubacteria group bacterium GW2011_GWC1_38_6]|nr:MAG: hypothetical protein US98_C0024G0003 [Parcubacteria group bacterium GW2011_GWC1_38_6]
METIILVFLLVIILLTAIILLRTNKKEVKSDSFLMLQQQLNHISQTLDNKLSESHKAIQMQFGQSAQIIQSVTEKLTRLDETNRQVVNFTDQLKNLQDILKNPKQRGILGEYFLETALKNVLPPNAYQMQYSFEDGTIVDAVVFVDKRIIPIDSKFSLENYNRIIESRDNDERKRYESAFIADLRARIDETAKYVKPEERTMDFAFMYIPSEMVFSDLIENKVGAITEDTSNLITYAFQKKVTIVSPTTFMAYLITILQGLRNQKISEEAQKIIKEIERLGKHLYIYSEYMKKIGNHLGTTVSSYNKARSEFAKIDKDVVKITGKDFKLKVSDGEVEPPLLED